MALARKLIQNQHSPVADRAEAARTDLGVVPPEADTLAHTPQSVQAALRALSRSRFFSDLALRALIFDLKQVSAYLTDPAVREEAREQVMSLIGSDTRVVWRS